MKFVKSFAAFAACALVSFSSAAYTDEYGGFTWTYQLSGANAVITKGTGQKSAALSPSPTAGVKFPAQLGGHQVIGIGYGAFYNTGVSGLIYADTPSYTSIGDYAFAKCASITGFVIPDSVTSVGSYAFSECTGMTTLTMGSGVTLIGSRAFQTATSLKSVTIPDSVTSIGDRAFESCSSLTTMTIGSGVTTIPTYFAAGCAKLTDLTIGSSVTSIGKCAFNGCSSLETVTIPLSVTELSEGAFLSCSSLTEAYVPVSLKGTFDESSVFGDCAENFDVTYYGVATVDGKTWYYKLLDDDSVELFPFGPEALAVSPAPTAGSTLVIPGELDGYVVTTIGNDAFSGTKMSSVVLPDDLTTIGYNAFVACINLSGITFSSKLTTIGFWAFNRCAALEEFNVPDTVTSIAVAAFASSGLECFSFGRGITEIPNYIFNGCTSLETVTIHRNVKSIGVDAFSFCPNLALIKVDRGDTERVSKMLKDSGFDVTGLTFEEDTTTPYYTIRFHRYDASNEKIEDYDFDYGVAMQLPKLSELGWARRGFKFKGWATSQVNAANGKVWKADGAWIKDGTAEGKTLSIYALWK